MDRICHHEAYRVRGATNGNVEYREAYNELLSHCANVCEKLKTRSDKKKKLNVVGYIGAAVKYKGIGMIQECMDDLERRNSVYGWVKLTTEEQEDTIEELLHKERCDEKVQPVIDAICDAAEVYGINIDHYDYVETAKKVISKEKKEARLIGDLRSKMAFVAGQLKANGYDKNLKGKIRQLIDKNPKISTKDVLDDLDLHGIKYKHATAKVFVSTIKREYGTTNIKVKSKLEHVKDVMRKTKVETLDELSKELKKRGISTTPNTLRRNFHRGKKELKEELANE